MTTNMREEVIGRGAMRPGHSRSPAVVVIFIAGMFLLPACKRSSESSSDGARPSVDPAASPVAEVVPDSVQNVMGRWVREDGGYILEVREARAGGHLDAVYFNPRPINVSRAAWMERAGVLQVFVELTDVGYPGATYMLRHDRERNRLVGEYTQPAMNQSFEVEFAPERQQR